MIIAGHTPTTEDEEKYLDGMMGLVVGDALGVPVEFSGREEMREHPVVDMMGYGTYPVPAGSWSDDSSMALASLSALHTDGINLRKTMDNFVAWEDSGEFTPSGSIFDEGNTCSMAIYEYKQSGDVATCGIYFYCVRELAKRNDSVEHLLQIALDTVFALYEQKSEIVLSNLSRRLCGVCLIPQAMRSAC